MTTARIQPPRTAWPFPNFAGPYGHVYWIEKDAEGQPFGDVWAAPQHIDGTFDPAEGLPVAEFDTPLTHGELLDVLLGLGAAAILRERELRATLEGLCAAGEDVMDEVSPDGDTSVASAMIGLGKALDSARRVLGIPDDYSTADYGNARERA